jgi:hypothetical protein
MAENQLSSAKLEFVPNGQESNAAVRPKGPVPFRIGLNMAGAVSAGAYTAGVLDFLIEALDAWYEERERQIGLHGADISKWAVPAHDVSLEVLSGASAGGMCAAISAVSLQEQFDHVTTTAPVAAAPVNRLYDCWVRRIDIDSLLGTADLTQEPQVVRSILDCTPIEQIADIAIAANASRRRARPWVSPELELILTVTNLRGIPYSVDPANNGSFEERINYHADEIYFRFVPSLNADPANSLPLVYPPAAGDAWPALKQAAMATGAFPGMLAPRILSRPAEYYRQKQWILDNPNPWSVTTLGCQIAATVAPAWDNKIVPAQLDIVCADGGVTNNDPFECARQYLVRQAGGGPSGHNPRQAASANAAVISVAPFPGDDAFNPSYNAAEQSSLVNSILALIPTFLTQTRFQGESLSLIQNADVHSRFAIAPSDDANPALPSLLCGSLGAIGGFIDAKFRDRDYQLGRRNCQRFLEVYFVLPENNVIVGAGLPRDKDEATPEIAKFAVKPPPGVTTDLDKRWFPIIPLMPSVRNEVSVAPRTNFKTTPERIGQVAALAVTRTETVLRALLDAAQPPHQLLGFVVEAAFGLGGGAKLRNFVSSYLTEQLRNVQQL